MCIACRKKTQKDMLQRYVLDVSTFTNSTESADNKAERNMQNSLLLDTQKNKEGRGYYFCQECIQKDILSKIKLKKPKNKKV